MEMIKSKSIKANIKENLNISLNVSKNFDLYNCNNNGNKKNLHFNNFNNNYQREKNNFELKEDIERLLIENDNSFVENSEISYNSFLNN
jgi:hypothetical protein